MIIAIVNNKGGVGKTTTAVHIAHALARRGNSVIAVDLDAQASLCLHFFKTAVVRDHFRARQNGVPLEAVMHEPTRVSVLPLSFWKADVDGYADAIRHYADTAHVIIVDCPPSLEDVRTQAALSCADYVVIPTEAERFSFTGVDTVLAAVREYPCEVVGMIITKFSPRKAAHEAWFEQLQTRYSDLLFSETIQDSSVFSSASTRAKTGYEYAGKRSIGALEAYNSIANELAEKVQLP